MPKAVCLGSECMGNKRKKLCVCLVGASIFILAAILIALTCCVVECQGQLKTSDLDEKLANLEEEKRALEKQRDRARAEVTALRSELAGTNQTLWETRGRWDSCRSLTHVLQNNITALKDEITQLGGRGTEQGRGQGEIDTLKQQLQEAQRHSDKLQADLRRLEQQQLHSPKNQSSGGSSLRIPLVAGYLNLLALSLAGILLL
nr:uncharacterized protein LOC101951162 isoform X2 [Chrysemys picta bellii]XP_008169759.1 uncharacterized protein LOC101951162 isoform X2 [Chrysemys picta bellii]XP_042717897.1 uncharacterized protein LOC101951162 isoform X2 [Chrysemys picta bellii]